MLPRAYLLRETIINLEDSTSVAPVVSGAFVDQPIPWDRWVLFQTYKGADMVS